MGLPWYHIARIPAVRCSTIIHIHKAVFFLPRSPNFFMCKSFLAICCYTEEQKIYHQTLQLSCLTGCNFSGCGSGTFPFHCTTQETSLSAMWISHTFSNFYSREKLNYHSKLTRAPSVVKRQHYFRFLSLQLPALVPCIPPYRTQTESVQVPWTMLRFLGSDTFSQVSLALSDARSSSLTVWQVISSF